MDEAPSFPRHKPAIQAALARYFRRLSYFSLCVCSFRNKRQGVPINFCQGQPNEKQNTFVAWKLFPRARGMREENWDA